jgi:predicted solute-binding protein
VATYLARLSYGFGSRERAALEAFYDRAVEAGELARVPALAA